MKLLLAAAILFAASAVSFAQTPDAVVRSLYAAHKSRATKPFFQTRSRALVDKYFAKRLADLIWKDAVDSQGEVGKLDFDPLYNAQDVRVTGFRIGAPEYGEGNRRLADVPVKFKNLGEQQTVLFRLEQTAKGAWKITDIFYPSLNTSLKSILSD